MKKILLLALILLIGTIGIKSWAQVEADTTTKETAGENPDLREGLLAYEEGMQLLQDPKGRLTRATGEVQ